MAPEDVKWCQYRCMQNVVHAKERTQLYLANLCTCSKEKTIVRLTLLPLQVQPVPNTSLMIRSIHILEHAGFLEPT